MKYNLSDICDYAKGKIDVAELDEDTYIFTCQIPSVFRG